MTDLPLFFVELIAKSTEGAGAIGVGVVIALLVIGLLKAIAVAGEPPTHRLCAASLIVLLSSLLGCSLLVPLNRSSVAPVWAMATIVWFTSVGIAAAPALAVAGLAGRGGREGESTRRGAAVWTLALTLTLAGWYGASTASPPGLESAYAERDTPHEPPHAAEPTASKARGPEKGLPQTATDDAASEPRQEAPTVTLASHQEEVATQTQNQPPSEEDDEPAEAEPDYLFPQYKFSYTIPGKAWRRLEHLTSSEVSPDLRLALGRRWPQIIFLVTATPLSRQVDDHALAAIVMGSIQGRVPDTEFGPTTRCTVAGIDGMLFETTGTTSSQRLAAKVWIGQHGGVAYQLSAIGAAMFRQRIDSEFSRLVDGFKLLDAEARLAGAADGGPAYPPHDFAYRLVRSDAGWIETGFDQAVPWFNYNGVHAHDAVNAGVVSMPLGDEPVDLDLLAKTMLSTVDFAPDDSALTELSRDLHKTPHAKHVIDYRARRSVEGKDLSYRLRLVVADGAAHLVACWVSSEVYGGEQKLREIIDQFEPTGDAPAEEPPANPQLSEAVATLLNDLAVAEFEQGSLRASREHFELAYKYAPHNATFATNMVEVVLETEGPAAAIAWLDERGTTSLEPLELARLRAGLLVQNEQFEEALRAYGEMARTGSLDDDSLKAMANVAVVADRYEEVLAAIDQALMQRESPLLRQWRATLLGRSGRHEEAIRALTGLNQQFPNDEDIAYALAEAYEEAERFDEGARVCEEGAQRHPTNYTFLSLLGRLKLQAEDFEGARDALERCLKMRPGDLEANELLTHVSALLGRGDNRRIREPIEPAPLPDVVAQAFAESPSLAPTPEIESHGGYFAHHAVGYEYRAGERRRITDRRQIKVLNRYGVERMAVMTHAFNPLSERLYVNELIVRDEEGHEIGRGDIADYYVLDESGDGLDSYNQVVKIPVPGVRPGCTIDLTITRESVSSRSEFGFESHFLTGSTPSAVRAVYLTGDTAGIKHQAFGVETQTPDASTLAWIASRPPPAVSESHQRDPGQYLPVVYLSDAGRDWDQLAHEYLVDLEATLVADPEVEQLAKSLCNNASTAAEKIEAIARHVQTALTYHGLEFGVRGVIPHPVGQVYRTGTGDCKDHSLLLHHLLRAVGVRSSLALANSSGPVTPDLPSLDQFDHMVVVIPEMPLRGGGVASVGVLDLTSKGFDPMLGLPPALAQKRLLVLDAEGPRLVKTGSVDASIGWIDCKRDAQVVHQENAFGAASLAVSETVTLGPQLSALLRLSFEGATEDQRRETLRVMIGENRSVHVNEVSITGIEDVSQPLVIRCQYQVTDAFQEVASAEPLLVGSIPNHWATLYCAPERTDQRRTPFEFTTPVTFRSSTRLTAPEGHRIVLSPNAAMAESTPAFSWKTTAQPVSDRAIDLSMIVRRPAGVYPAATYKAFEASSNRALRLSCKAVTIARNGQPLR